MIKDKDDFRVQNRIAFKMEQVYKFDLDNYIQYYEDEDLFKQHSDDEDYSDAEGDNSRDDRFSE